MRRAGLIAIGGALGALARVGAGTVLGDRVALVLLMMMNLPGAFALGWLTAWLSARSQREGTLRPLLGVGVLGAFTTFSSFALLLTQLPVVAAAAYAVVMVAGGLLAARAGLRLGSA